MKSILLVFLVLISFCIACQPKQNMVYLSNNNFENEVSQARFRGLQIQEGDVLDILVSSFEEITSRPFNRATMSQTGKTTENGGTAEVNEYQVNEDGYIQMPVLGMIFCKGMTKSQLKQDIESRLKQYLTEPTVTIKLTNFNISVLGDVGSPGQKTSTSEKLNVFQALALAGDLNDSAKRTNLKLIRYSEQTGKDDVISLDLSEASIVNSPYYYLQQNDILYVEPDKNKQISANTTNPNRSLFFQIGAALMGVATFIIAIAK